MSFYGGKQGRTYHLVEHFEAINLNDYFEQYNSENSYAVGDKIRIQLPSESEEKYYKVIQAIEVGETNLSSKLTESTWKGMCQQFAKGGQYTKVLYGQYVIIDTKTKADPSNGIIYRRGFDYQATGESAPGQGHWKQGDSQFEKYIANPGNGAMYIGQIVGPTGSGPNVEATIVNTLASTVPPEVTSTPEYDEYGNITQVTLGFDFPKLSINPAMNPLSTPYSTANVEEKDSSTQYPFQYDLEFTIPSGKHGQDISAEVTGEIPNQVFSVTTTSYENKEPVVSSSTIGYRVIDSISTVPVTDHNYKNMSVAYTYGDNDIFTPLQIDKVENGDNASIIKITLSDTSSSTFTVPSASFKIWGIYNDYPDSPPSGHDPSDSWTEGDIIRIEGNTSEPDPISDGFYMYDSNSQWTFVFASMSDPTKYIQIGETSSGLYDNGVLLVTSDFDYYWED